MNLKDFISDYRISQKELADLFGCAASNVSNIVAGKRNLTGLQVRLLIDKYGFETVAKYAEAGEMPQGPIVNVDMRKNEIKNNQGPVQAGDGNSMTTDAGLISVMQKQAEHITELLKQQDRLIKLLENKQ